MSKVAAIQMASGPNVKANLAEAEKLIKIAVQQGAELVVLPENFAIMGLTEADKVKIAEEPGSGLLQDFLKEQATRHGIWLVGGTVPISSEESGKVFAACLLISSQGEQVARYDKIHLFDPASERSGTCRRLTVRVGRIDTWHVNPESWTGLPRARKMRGGS